MTKSQTPSGNNSIPEPLKKSNSINTIAGLKSPLEKSKEFAQGNVYDNVVRVMLERHTRFMIPIVNKFLGKHYTKNASIVLHNDTHHKTLLDFLELRITDAYFSISENDISETFHLEVQSNGDSTMIIRIVEYDFMLAIEDFSRSFSHLEYKKGNMSITIPETLVLYLREDNKKTDSFDIPIHFKDQTLNYTAKVVHVQDYTLADIENDDLYFFLPFYLMRLENILKSDEDLQVVKNEIFELDELLNKLYENGKLKELEATNLKELITAIIYKLSENRKAQEELLNMNGLRIKTNSEIIYEAGEAAGEASGYGRGKADGYDRGKADGYGRGKAERDALRQQLIDAGITPVV